METENLKLDVNEPRTLGDWARFQELAGVDTWDEIIEVLSKGPQSPRQALAVFWMAGTQADPDFDIERAKEVPVTIGALKEFVEETFGS